MVCKRCLTNCNQRRFWTGWQRCSCNSQNMFAVDGILQSFREIHGDWGNPAGDPTFQKGTSRQKVRTLQHPYILFHFNGYMLNSNAKVRKMRHVVAHSDQRIARSYGLRCWFISAPAVSCEGEPVPNWVRGVGRTG